jgi:hypothetical protein
MKKKFQRNLPKNLKQSILSHFGTKYLTPYFAAPAAERCDGKYCKWWIIFIFSVSV